MTPPLLIRTTDGGKVSTRAETKGHAQLQVTATTGTTAAATLSEGEVVMAIEALAVVYAELVGARADSLARGINRTLSNRTRAARERRQTQEAR